MSGKADSEEIKVEVAPETPSEVASSDAATPPPTSKSCPYCNKTLDVRAVTCRYCGRDLYSENAMKIVLTSEEWDTNVPQWMIDEENKMLAQKRLLKRIRKQSWRVVAGVIFLGVGVIVWRLLTAPPEPHQQLLSVRTQPLVVPKATPQSTPTPEPVTSSTEASSLASALGAAPSSHEDVTPSPEPTPSSEPDTGTPSSEPSALSSTDNPTASESAYEINVTAEDLVTEFEESRSFADEKYMGQELRIAGELKTIDTTTKVPYVLFDTGKHNNIKCLLKPEAKKQLRRVKPGKYVVIRGKCDGAFLDIVISDCEFLF